MAEALNNLKVLGCIIWLLMIMNCTKKQDPSISTPSVPPDGSAPNQSVLSDSAAVIYISGGYTNELFAVNASTGKVLWRVKTRGRFTGSPAYTRGTVLVAGSDGVSEPENPLLAFDTTGKQIWNFKLKESLIQTVIASDGIVYAQDNEHVYALNSKDGSVKWICTLPQIAGGDINNMILNNNTLYCSNDIHDVFAINAETGEVKWKNSMDDEIFSIVAFKDLIYLSVKNYVGTVDLSSDIEVCDARTGAKRIFASQLPISYINIKYGRIYGVSGVVFDSTSLRMIAPRVNDAFPLMPENSTYPILTDSLAIMPREVTNAFTGASVCRPFSAEGGYTYPHIYSTTYFDHKLYYTTTIRYVYNFQVGGHYYGDIYAYDISNKKLLWQTTIDNFLFIRTEPCVVTKSGKAYVGGFSFN